MVEIAPGTTVQIVQPGIVAPIGVIKGETGAPGGSDGSFAGWINDTASATRAALNSSLVPRVDTAETNRRTYQIDTPVFDDTFDFSAISDNQDGLFTWRNLTVDAGYGGAVGGGGPISYFKAVGGTIEHTGDGNLDAFWVSVVHDGPREAGAFIADLETRQGGNLYGGHFRLIVSAISPDVVVGNLIELTSHVTRGAGDVSYGLEILNSGTAHGQAAIQIDAVDIGKWDHAINISAGAASSSNTCIQIGGAWGAAMDVNQNPITNIGSLAGAGSAGSRNVRLADHLALDNARYVKFKDSGGALRNIFSLSSNDNVRVVAGKAGGELRYYDSTETTVLASIKGDGRGDFSTAGVTTKYTAAASAPAFVANGTIEVWRDSTNGLDYICIDSNGTRKMVEVS